MREAPTPHSVSGDAPCCGRPLRALRTGIVRLLLTLALGCGLAPIASAQDPSVRLPDISKNIPFGNTPAPPKSSFAKNPGGIFGKAPKIDRAQPIYLQTDRLIYDDKTNRVIAQGNVEIYYNNYVLTADKVVYDQSSNRL